MLMCPAPAAVAQVGGDAAPSTQPSQRSSTPDSAPRSPISTSSEILGPRPSSPASPTAVTDRTRPSPAVGDGALLSPATRDGSLSSPGVETPQPLAAPTAGPPSRTAPSAPAEESATQTCGGSNGDSSGTDVLRQSQFPGVSTSQFQRAGVGTDAFTRPGVSTEELRALVSGQAAGSCRRTRDVVLYPEPEPAAQRRVIPSPPVEP